MKVISNRYVVAVIVAALVAATDADLFLMPFFKRALDFNKTTRNQRRRQSIAANVQREQIALTPVGINEITGILYHKYLLG